MSDKAVVRELCACFARDRSALAPMHRQGILAASQGNVVEVAIQYDFRIKLHRHDGIEQVAYRIVTGTLRHPK
jgi:hypothetical protein